MQPAHPCAHRLSASRRFTRAVVGEYPLFACLEEKDPANRIARRMARPQAYDRLGQQVIAFQQHGRTLGEVVVDHGFDGGREGGADRTEHLDDLLRRKRGDIGMSAQCVQGRMRSRRGEPSDGHEQIVEYHATAERNESQC
jgi:hypothetical protein